MSEEEKQAIETLKKLKIGIEILNNLGNSLDHTSFEEDKEDVKAINVILNLIDKQQKEIEEKCKKYVDLCFEAGKIKADLDIAERVIDKMAEELGKIGVFKHSKEQIKEYFYKEIEND